jgi:hypothetical protein
MPRKHLSLAIKHVRTRICFAVQRVRMSWYIRLWTKSRPFGFLIKVPWNKEWVVFENEPPTKVSIEPKCFKVHAHGGVSKHGMTPWFVTIGRSGIKAKSKGVNISHCCKSTWYPRVGLGWHIGPWPRRYINGFFTETTLKLILSKMLWICFRLNAAFKLCNCMPKSLAIVVSKTWVVLCRVDYENERICPHAILRRLYNTSRTHFLTLQLCNIAPIPTLNG